MAGNWIDRVSHRRGVWLSVQTRALLRLPRAALVHIASRARADPAREPRRRPATLPARSHDDRGRSTSRPGRPALTAGVATHRLAHASPRRARRPSPAWHGGATPSDRAGERGHSRKRDAGGDRSLVARATSTLVRSATTRPRFGPSRCRVGPTRGRRRSPPPAGRGHRATGASWLALRRPAPRSGSP